MCYGEKYMLKRYIILFSLGLCFATPVLSQAIDTTPMIRVTNVHNGQNDAAFRTSDGVFMHVKARSIDGNSMSLDNEIKNLVKERTIPEPTVKMVLPIKDSVIEVNNDGVRSLLAEFMYGWPLKNRTDMVLVTDYEGTRYYYKLQFYRDRLPNGVRIEQLRQMIMDAQFNYK